MHTRSSDTFYESQLFQDFFKKSSQSLILKANPPHFNILAVSDYYLNATHKDRDELLNRGWFEVFPGSKANAGEKYSVEQSFHRVIATKRTDKIPVFSYEIFVPETGERETLYWSNVNDPILDEEGNVAYIINTTDNVTDAILQQQAVMESKALKELLEKEVALNLQLQQSQNELQQLNNELESRIAQRTEALRQNEAKFKNMAEQAPVAIATFMGPQFIIELFNERVLEFWGRTAEQVAGLPLFTALPESSGQGFEELLTKVYTTGQRFVASELPVTLMRNGELDDTWINFIYEPIHDENGVINGIMVVCIEVTEQVNARKNTERLLAESRMLTETLTATESNLRLALGTGNLGVWSRNLASDEIDFDARCREIYGFTHIEEITMEKILQTVDPEYLDIALQALELSMQGQLSETEYYIIHQPTQKRRWIKGISQSVLFSDNKQSRITGIIIDLTEQKLDEQRKDDFISMVSHELKTPLTSLSGYVQIVRMDAEKKKDTLTAGILQKASKQVGKMTTMINGFLNVSRLESGKIQIDKKRFDMADLVKEVKEETASSINSHQVIFDPVEPTLVCADWDKISHVINNLISNAIKYAAANTTVRIACINANNMAQVSVHDQGIGIKEEDIPKLFERYYRVGKDSSVSGFGIGLYLSKEIIDRHQGNIWVESEPDKGSTFYFTLPVEP